MSILDRVKAYIAHDDPATAMVNAIAFIVGANGPFYPLYVSAIAGISVIVPSLWTMLATPFFLAIPALSRFSSRGARLAMPIVGGVNTVWCAKILGYETGVGLFMLPCILLAGLLYRQEERLLFILVGGVALGVYFLPGTFVVPPMIGLTQAANQSLYALNSGSVAVLTFVIALQLGEVLRGRQNAR